MSKNKQRSLLNFLLILGIAVFANVLANVFYGYFDLTEDKRFTLTEPTRELLRAVDDPVLVRVLLGGDDYPAGFKRLQRSVREMLDDLRGETGYIEYEFVDPAEGSVEEINERRRQLAQDGLEPTNLRVQGVDGTDEKLIYPYALLSYRGRKMTVNLLDNEGTGGQEQVLNNSVNQLEYKFASAINRLGNGYRPNVAYLQGHGELAEPYRRELTKSLQQFYNVGTIVLDSVTYLTPEIEVLIVARPRAPFSDRDKFKLDQYVMRGGKIIWMLDKLDVSVDSLYRNRTYVPREYPLEVDELLFRYGVRLNSDLVEDLQSSRIQLVVGNQGGRPQFDLFPWYYHPTLTPKEGHPVTKGLDLIDAYFVSTIDTTVTTRTPLKKSVLLASSPNSRVKFWPMELSFDMVRYDAQVEKFNQGNQIIGVMLEGEFPSLYTNRVSDGMRATLTEIGQEFRERSVPTKQLVIADGDFAKNPYNPESDATLPLGFNRFEQYQFDNKDFLLNAVEYMQSDGGFVEARGKEVKLRPLNTAKAQTEQTKWQLLNTVVPLAFLLLFGLGYQWVRRRRYAR